MLDVRLSGLHESVSGAEKRKLTAHLLALQDLKLVLWVLLAG